MNRRDWLRTGGTLGAGLMLEPWNWLQWEEQNSVNRKDFGPDFRWGVATAAHQIEGGWNADGKGPSVWDTFSQRKGKIKGGHTGKDACEFYTRYPTDLQLMKAMGIADFRFSLSWSRLLPGGIGAINPAGVDFYNRVIDQCLELGITPWVTLYHWDLPQALEDKGGWTRRAVIDWFSEYTLLASKKFGDRVKNWMVLNEPMAFTGLGYMLGIHAPGRKGLGNFLDAVYHAALAQGVGGKILRDEVKNASIGTTFSASWVEPHTQREADIRAAERFDALWNRLFLEPALLGTFPTDTLPALRRLEKRAQPGDEARMKFNFDFIGLQNYTREVVRRWFFPPILWAKMIPPKKRTTEPLTEMGWEVYPDGIYHLLKKYAAYPGMPPIIVTENGAAFPDRVEGEEVHDQQRVDFIQRYLAQVLRAQKEGVNVKGYFIWTFMDNFEWAEGYHPRFGLVYVDFPTQRRIIKDSGKWFTRFLTQ